MARSAVHRPAHDTGGQCRRHGRLAAHLRPAFPAHFQPGARTLGAAGAGAAARCVDPADRGIPRRRPAFRQRRPSPGIDSRRHRPADDRRLRDRGAHYRAAACGKIVTIRLAPRAMEHGEAKRRQKEQVMAGKLAVLVSSPADYQRLGLSPSSIAPWEDGARTDDSAGTYEWWYFDAHLADGAKLVVTFMNKDIAEPQKPLSPLLRLDLDLPGGRHFEKLVHYPPGEWSAVTDHADVRLGENRFTGDLHRYRIQAVAEEISVDVTLTGEVPPWRPATGYMLFGADRSREFAWLPSVPQGAVTVTYSVDGEQHETAGVGYHDHNWGNVGLMKVVHDWYWARGQAGPYSVIASYITAT